jgi:hypothetical protein
LEDVQNGNMVTVNESIKYEHILNFRKFQLRMEIDNDTIIQAHVVKRAVSVEE